MTNELSYNVKWKTNNTKRLQESIRLQLSSNLVNSQRIMSNIEHLENIKFPFFLHRPCKLAPASLSKPNNLHIKQQYKSNAIQYPIHRCSTSLRQYQHAINDIAVKKSERKYSVGSKMLNATQSLHEIMLKHKLYRALRMSFDKTVELNSRINPINISYEHYNQYLRSLQSTLGIPMKLIFLLKSEFTSLDPSNQCKNYKDIYSILVKGNWLT
jgi:hypothetical protein